ncbi:apolipo protein O-domain-containing protein [Epithele typhae]|uniref:apolipo protein O-domain-containing protein n=1 Tax=Epithele typhae TaxID=378194 RepID=UPI002008898D|nr:apolipo protein O-domain-containing protein [Epithele typhae]KAH9916977.1 apolipo protein O-domain-containing protein [Epithele typhae]
MLRLLASRRAALLATAAVGVHEAHDKLPIYPVPEPDVLLLETPSELEKHIGVARRTLTGTYEDAHGRVQALVSRWIGVEQAVETRVKALVAPDEPLTPGILYVGVATLTGSVLARNRLLWRLTLPPALLVLSLQHFLPKTAANVSAYLGELEDAHLPALAQKHAVANAHSAMAWEQAKDAVRGGQESVTAALTRAAGGVEEATGLKLREVLGWRERAAKEVRVAAEKEADVVKVVVETKVEEVKEAVEKKVEEVKRLV